MSDSKEPAPAPYFDGSQVCAQADPDAWFPDGGNVQKVKALCRTCRFLAPCREYAVQHDVEGIWGATGPRERRHIRNARGITAIPLLRDNEERNALIARLTARGLSSGEIAAQVGLHRESVLRINKTRRGAA